MIEDFRNHQRQEEASLTLDRDNFQENYGRGKAVAATFKENIEEENENESKHNRPKFDDKECLCGYKHAWIKCFYLNPSKRTSNWKGKREVYEKINKVLKNPKVKWVIKKYGYNGFDQEKVIDNGNSPEVAVETPNTVGAVTDLILRKRQLLSLRRSHPLKINYQDQS